jgi:hypothetical protein
VKLAVLLQYDGICGLSGSLGSGPEIQFLKSTYNADTFQSPSFLDTCTVSKKQPVTLVGAEVNAAGNDGTVQIFTSPGEHYTAVVNAAVAWSAKVPVIIICETRSEAEALWKKFAPYAEQVDRDTGRITVDKTHKAQLFLNNPSEKPSEKVMRACDPVMEGTRKGWRITVTDTFGGRGQDYRINDASVNEAGGILVIATTFPASQREWLQWKGRTARSDRKGQYMLMMRVNREARGSDGGLDGKVSAAKESYRRNGSGAGVMRGEAFINEVLLPAREEECGKRLDAAKAIVDAGIRLNRLCDKFWEQEGGIKETEPWPNGDRQHKLRDLLNQGSVLRGTFTAADVEKWAAELGIQLGS